MLSIQSRLWEKNPIPFPNTTHKAKLDNVLSISTDPIKNISFPAFLANGLQGRQWPRQTQHMNTEEPADSGKLLCVGMATGGGDRHFLEQTLCPWRREGEDKALTLPSDSSHPLDTRTVAQSAPGHDPSLETQPSMWSSWTFRTKGNPPKVLQNRG